MMNIGLMIDVMLASATVSSTLHEAAAEWGLIDKENDCADELFAVWNSGIAAGKLKQTDPPSEFSERHKKIWQQGAHIGRFIADAQICQEVQEMLAEGWKKAYAQGRAEALRMK